MFYTHSGFECESCLCLDRGTHREMYITDGADLDMEDSEDELPPMKFLLDQLRTTGTTEYTNIKGKE